MSECGPNEMESPQIGWSEVYRVSYFNHVFHDFCLVKQHDSMITICLWMARAGNFLILYRPMHINYARMHKDDVGFPIPSSTKKNPTKQPAVQDLEEKTPLQHGFFNFTNTSLWNSWEFNYVNLLIFHICWFMVVLICRSNIIAIKL